MDSTTAPSHLHTIIPSRKLIPFISFTHSPMVKYQHSPQFPAKSCCYLPSCRSSCIPVLDTRMIPSWPFGLRRRSPDPWLPRSTPLPDPCNQSALSPAPGFNLLLVPESLFQQYTNRRITSALIRGHHRTQVLPWRLRKYFIVWVDQAQGSSVLKRRWPRERWPN